MRLIGSFCVYRPPLNSLWGARGAPLGPSGTPLGSFCPSWVLPLGLFGMSWGAFGVSLAPFGPPWGPLWLLCGKSLKLDVHGGSQCRFFDRRPQRNHRLGIHPRIPQDPPDPVGPANQVSSAAARDLPSTRAGGQDDVSSKQTPSNYYSRLIN